MKCLTDEQIAVFIDGMTEDREYGSIKKHLAECEKCLAKMNDVYTLTELDTEIQTGITKPPMPRLSNVFNFRNRYIIPAAAAAILIVISLSVFKLTTSVNITPDNGNNIADKNSGNGSEIKVINSSGKNIFALNVKSETVMDIRRDAGKITEKGISVNSFNPMNSSNTSKVKVKTIDERLAFERKALLIKCGYYYFMIRQSRDKALLETAADIMEMAFPDIKLKDLKDSSFDNYEKSITKVNSTDRGNFIKGYFLSYYLYTDGKGNGDSTSGIVESLKDEEALGIGNLFIFKGEKLDALKAEMKKFFMM